MRSALVYNRVISRTVSRLKFGNGAHLAEPLGRLLIRAGADIMQGVDVVVPIPMHAYNIFLRKYNQSTLLAFYVARFYNLDLNSDAMRKSRYTRAQRKMTRRGRLHNLRGAFTVVNPNSIRNKIVLLVDDVITTGSTVRECSRVLRSAGAREVRVLSLARTIPGITRLHLNHQLSNG